ncbi:MAG: DUF6434 domain-containing protein [Aggregatilineales bacterium]
MKNTEQRPPIKTIKTGAELRRWYWLKEELVAYCQEHGIPYSAGKFELLDRIARFMDTGETPTPKRKNITSKFDWHSEQLSAETIITDSYKNTQNVRRFMTMHIGKHFKFNIDFMAWMRANAGKTLGEAVIQWQDLEARKADANFQTDIADHNQYNQYLRDFFEANPTLTTRDARTCWEFKRSLPTPDGRHVYDADDLQALKK